MAKRNRQQDPETVVEPGEDVDGQEPVAPSRRARARGSDIGQRIADGIAEGMQRLVPRRIKPGSSAFDPHSPFRSKKGPHLKGDLFDNGIKCWEDSLYDEEINLANSIVRSGRYVHRIVTVRVSDDAGSRVVFINYGNKSIDQRMENKNHWRNFKELLELIVKEQGTVELVGA